MAVMTPAEQQSEDIVNGIPVPVATERAIRNGLNAGDAMMNGILTVERIARRKRLAEFSELAPDGKFVGYRETAHFPGNHPSEPG